MGLKVHLESFRLNRSEGNLEIVGEYHLISEEGVVMAKQSFNGYNDIKITSSRETMELMKELEESLRLDVRTTLGIKD